MQPTQIVPVNMYVQYETLTQPLATVTWTGEMITLYIHYLGTSSAVERIPFSLPTMELELDLGELDLTSENAEFDFDDFDGKLGALPPCCVLRTLCCQDLSEDNFIVLLFSSHSRLPALLRSCPPACSSYTC